MRLLSLNLEKYGSFTGRTLAFRPEARVHIVHGPNEAGKTSSLSAIGDLLFGFGKTTPYAFQHANPDLRVGASLRLRDGRGLDFRRRKGNANTLVDGADKPLPDDFLLPVTGTLTRRDFESEFGLTAEAMRAGGRALVQTGGRLAEMLAAGSAGLSALSRLAGTLDAEANALFSERKVASKPFYLADEEFKKAEKSLKESVVTVDAWKAALAQVEAARTAAEAVEQGQKAQAGELARLERIKAVAPVLRRLEARREELAGLADLPDIAAHLAPDWRKALADVVDLAGQTAELEAEREAASAQLDTLAVQPELLAAGQAIEQARERIGAIAKAASDLPRRVQDRDDAHAQLADMARRLNLADVAALLAQVPDEASLAAARALLARSKAAAQAVEQAEAAKTRHVMALARFQQNEPLPAHVQDPAALKRRCDALASIPLDADRLRRETLKLEIEEKQLGDALARLTPALASIDALARLPLPETASLAAARQSIEGLEREAGQLQAQAAAIRVQAGAARAEIAVLSAQGQVMTREALVMARGVRDQALQNLEAALNAAIGERQARLETLRVLQARADELADLLLGEGDRATRRLLAEQKLEEAGAALARHEAGVKDFDGRQAAGARDWLALWQSSGLTPLDPARMIIWQDKVRDLFHRHQAFAPRRVELAALKAGLDEKRPLLAVLAADFGLELHKESPAEVSFAEVLAALAEVQDAWAKSRAQATEGKMLAASVADAGTTLETANAKTAAVQAEWLAGMGKLGLAQAIAGEAEAALAAWAGTVEPRVKLAREQRSIDTILADQAAFESAVTILVAQAGPDLAGQLPGQALQVLVQRLAAARQTETGREHMQKAQAARIAKLAELARRAARARRLVSEAEAALPGQPDVGMALDRLAQRAVLRAGSADLAAQLDEAAAGHDEARLRAELALVDLDQITGLISAGQAKVDAGRVDLGEAIAALRAAEQARDKISEGRNAGQAQQARTEAGADMLRIGEEWLVRHMAVHLARAAIQRHRAAAQDPVIARASALFGAVTSGGFAGLVTAYDENDNPVLVGQRASGGKVVKVEEMSEGTRDQLFLVLRLALLEQRAGEPLPFVGDDLLASFDEARTGEMLEVLARFGESSQVILFTHHAHVVEIALKRLGAKADVLGL